MRSGLQYIYSIKEGVKVIITCGKILFLIAIWMHYTLRRAAVQSLEDDIDHIPFVRAANDRRSASARMV